MNSLKFLRNPSSVGIAALLVFFLNSSKAWGDVDDCQVAKSAIHIASEIRGLKQLREVPCRLRTKPQVEAYLRETFDKKLPPEKIQSEEVVYKLLGLIPEDFAYVNGIIQLYTEQVGGYYDPDEDYYAMASWLPMSMQTPIAVHELTHALQDQHFHLEDFTDPSKLTTDESLARAAVIEGDATAVMADYSRELANLPPLRKSKSVVSLISQNLGGAMFTSSLRDAPSSLQAILIFPYISGLHFVHDRLRSGGYSSIDMVIRKPPRSTSEIIHPEKYPREEQAVVVDLRDDERQKISNPELSHYSDTLGEFVISTLLSRWITPLEASRVSAHWAGDRLELFDGLVNNRKLLCWSTLWDSESGADGFFRAISKGYQQRFGPITEEISASTVSHTFRDVARIERNGKSVRIVIEGTVKH